jgi:hypothetical protein
MILQRGQNLSVLTVVGCIPNSLKFTLTIVKPRYRGPGDLSRRGDWQALGAAENLRHAGQLESLSNAKGNALNESAGS